MTSTPEDGELVQHHADQEDTKTDVQNQASFSLTSESINEYFNDVETRIDHMDELLSFDQQEPGQDENEEDELENVDAVPGEDVLTKSATPVIIRRQSPSVDGSASIPDDTPSVQESFDSTSRSDALSVPSPSGGNISTPPRRPFDLRFQSRLSTSTLGSPRASSPAFLANHSRQSSLASFAFLSASEPDDSAAPWEVIRWTKLNRMTSQLFAEASLRNFGTPTCIAVTDQVIVGTSKGVILVFDHQQTHKAIIGSGTRAIECGSVTALAISADHTTIAAGHATGHIFTWEIGRASRPFLQIPPIDIGQPEARRGDGHVSGSTVLHVGFLGFRRTALVSADDRGMAFSHLASRGTGSLGRTVRTTRILGRYPDLVTRGVKPSKKSSVLAFASLPLGNIERSTDAVGLVAMLTPYLLVIVSTTPVAQTQHKAARPKDVAAHSAMTAALAWFPAIKLKGGDSIVPKSKLAYAWSNILMVLDLDEVEPKDVSDKEKPPEFQFLTRSRYMAEEAIVAIQWLSRSVMAVLTITQQLLIIEDVTMMVTDSFDLLPKDVFHSDVYSHQLTGVIEDHDDADTSMHGVVADAYHMSFRAYKGRLFLLGFKGLWWGSLTNWADRLLAMMDAGDFIGGIRLATTYYAGVGEKLTIGLPEDDSARAGLVREKLLEMISASLKYAFGKNRIAGTRPLDEAQLMDLAVACVAACLSIDDQDFLFDEVFPWYDDHDQGAMFIDVLEPYILDGKVTALPPAALQVLVDHFKTMHTSSKLEEIICLLDPRSMNLDQVTSLCKQNNLYDAYIYVWNTAFHDYIGPLDELLQMAMASHRTNGNSQTTRENSDTPHKMFAYISFVLTGRVYPTGLFMDDTTATAAKLQIYDYLFSGNDRNLLSTSSVAFREGNATTSFPKLRAILSYDSSSFMIAMNEAFEDSFLNTGGDEDPNEALGLTPNTSIYNRRFIVQILLNVMSSGFEASDTIYLDMFIARNLPKYPQYMLLAGTTLQETFVRLSHYKDDDLRDDAQLSVEYLLSVYHPHDALALVPVLRRAKFFRVLKSIFKQELYYPELIDTYFLDEDDQNNVFEVIVECLQERSRLTTQQRADVGKVVEKHAADLTSIDVSRAAVVIDQVLPERHTVFVEAQSDSPSIQFRYLRTLLEPDISERAISENISGSLLEEYIRLMCRYAPAHVVEYVKTVKEDDLNLEAVIPDMETSGVIDAAVILLARQGQVRDAMNRLVRHIGTLHAALKALIDNAEDSPDAVGTNEAIEDVLESIERYSGVGIWICQGQSKNAQRSRSAITSPRKPSNTPLLSYEETLWLDLLVAIVSVAQDISLTPSKEDHDDSNQDLVQTSIRTTVQNAFTALLTTTTTTKEVSRTGTDFTFLRILRAFLTRAAESSPSLSALRSVIASIFSAYAYEASLLTLSNSMLDKDLFVHVDEVTKLRQQGWRPRGQVCEICRRRVWGPGLGMKIWRSWESVEETRRQRRQIPPEENEVDDTSSSRGKGKAAAILPPVEEVGSSNDIGSDPADEEEVAREGDALVVFSCRHLYHQGCLMRGNAGVDGDDEGAIQLQRQRHGPGQGQVQGYSQGRQQLSVGRAENVGLRCPACP